MTIPTDPLLLPRFCRVFGLPPHVTRGVRSSTLQGLDVVYDISRARTRSVAGRGARMLLNKCPPGCRTPMKFCAELVPGDLGPLYSSRSPGAPASTVRPARDRGKWQQQNADEQNDCNGSLHGSLRLLSRMW